MENNIGNSYILSIRISSDGFSLSVNEKTGLLLSTKNVAASVFSLSADDLIKILSNETQLNYEQIRIICESDTYIFIPTALFKPEEATDYINFQHKIPKNERIIVNKIPTWDTVNIFTLPANLVQAIQHVFPLLTIQHQMSHLLEDSVKPQPDNVLHIYIRSTMLDVIALKDGKPVLLNSFSYQTTEDFSYHALNVVEQLSLDMDKCKVYLYNVDKKPELAKVLGTYVTLAN
jgi:hypothetical protein